MQHHANLDHAVHDTALIAGHAAGDLDDTRASAAAALLASCSDCSALHRDLVAISAATRALPRRARAPRDYRLTAEQAGRLRRGSWLRTLLRPFGATPSLRPLAAAFSSLGVAGLLVAAFVPGLAGGAASGPSMERDGQSAVGAPGPTTAPAAPVAVDASLDAMFGGQAASGAPVDQEAAQGSGQPLTAAGGGDKADNGGRTGTGDTLNASAPANLLVVASLGFLLLGLAIFGLRIAARRVG